jgi:5-methylcytosine-specific restriction endonuclease McrA
MTSTDPRYQTTAWRALRALVLDRDLWTCQVRDKGCTHGATEVDHITPAIEGGDFYNPTNLRASCKRCNSTRGARLAAARQARYNTAVAVYESRW